MIIDVVSKFNLSDLLTSLEQIGPETTRLKNGGMRHHYVLESASAFKAVITQSIHMYTHLWEVHKSQDSVCQQDLRDTMHQFAP